MHTSSDGVSSVTNKMVSFRLKEAVITAGVQKYEF